MMTAMRIAPDSEALYIFTWYEDGFFSQSVFDCTNEEAPRYESNAEFDYQWKQVDLSKSRQWPSSRPNQFQYRHFGPVIAYNAERHCWLEWMEDGTTELFVV